MHRHIASFRFIAIVNVVFIISTKQANKQTIRQNKRGACPSWGVSVCMKDQTIDPVPDNNSVHKSLKCVCHYPVIWVYDA